jgi:hypothetical protein
VETRSQERLRMIGQLVPPSGCGPS